MTERRSRSTELLFEVLSGSTSRLQTQLRSQLLDAIRSGRVSPGDRLPSTRQLAKDLAVARGTVVAVYDQLVQEGYVTAVQGSGTTVAARPQPTGPLASTEQRRPRLFDLRPGVPDLRAFPRQQWARASTHVLQTIGDAELGYIHPWGAEALRAEMAPYLARTRHLVTDADGVVVTSGVTQGLRLMCHVLADRGHRVLAVEDPSNAIQRQVLGRYLAVVDVPVDSEGIKVGELRATGARAVLVTPAHQYPTGVAMSGRRREALVAWAADVDGVILEDDYDAEFQFRTLPAPSLQASLPDRVVHLSSISKTLIPGARLGWAVVPRSMRHALILAKRDSDFGTSVLVQHAFARLLATGDYDRHVRRQRGHYRARRAALVAQLAKQLPDWTVRGAEAGLHLWLEPPDQIDEAALVEAAGTRGLLILGMGSMCGAVRAPGLALGFARLSVHQAAEVADLLADAVRAVASRPGPSPTAGSWPAPPSPDGVARLGTTGIDYFAALRIEPGWGPDADRAGDDVGSAVAQA